MPVQRTPRYHLLLEQLVKNTPEDHPDYLPVFNAIDTIKRVNNMMNERYHPPPSPSLPLPARPNVLNRKRETENRTMLHSIYIRLEPSVDVLMENHCVYVREGLLLHEGDSFVFFLFNCLLLQCHAKEGGMPFSSASSLFCFIFVFYYLPSYIFVGVRLIVVNEIPINPLSIVTPISDSPHYGTRLFFPSLLPLSRSPPLPLSPLSPSPPDILFERVEECISIGI